MMTLPHYDKGIRTLNDDKAHRSRYVRGGNGIKGLIMPERTDWEAKARGIVRGEMARQDVTYAQLVEKLAAIGVTEDERNLRNKVSRGKFTAAFLLQVMAAMGVGTIPAG